MSTNTAAKAELLRELDRVGHSDRVKRMAFLGRQLAGSSELEALLDELFAGSPFEQMLALYAAGAARSQKHVLEGLRAPTVTVRRLAIRLIWAVADDEALVAVTLESAQDTRKRILWEIVRHRRRPLAERLVAELSRELGPEEALSLLPTCGAEIVRKTLGLAGYALSRWHALAFGHPDVVLDYFESTFAATPQRLRAALWVRYGTAMGPLIELRPERALELAMKYGPEDDVPVALWVRLGGLMRRCPEGVHALLCRETFLVQLGRRGLPSGLREELRRFSVPRQRVLFAAMIDNHILLSQALAALPPRERAGRFLDAYEGREIDRLVWPDALLEVLPHELRNELAEKMLELREIRDNPYQELCTTANLDIDTARPTLERAAKASKAEDRAQALSLLVRCTGTYRRGLTETLNFLERLRNEQDPVRLAGLQALAELSPTLFREDHVSALDELVTFVVEARDTSWGTRHAVQLLVFALMRANASEPNGELFTFATRTLERLLWQTGSVFLPRLADVLPRGAEHRLVAALEPFVRKSNKRESFLLALALADALGKRGWNVTPLQEMIEEATRAGPDYIAQRAIGLWLAAPRTRDQRVRLLLDRDPSCIAISDVFLHLHRRRQEWLDPFLAGRKIKGRFLTGRTVYVLWARDGFYRWLPRQQDAWSRLLHKIIDDKGRDAGQRAQAISVVARLPRTDVGALVGLLAGEAVPIIEAALGALAWLDRPESALPVLLEHLDSDRARVAMYAVPRCARLVPPRELLRVLDELLRRERLKVTVHKEAIRLLGSHPSAESLALLKREAAKEGIHRDVLIAMGHAAARLHAFDESWEILRTLATSENPNVARSLLMLGPSLFPTSLRPRFARLLLEVSSHTDLLVRRQVWGVLDRWSVGIEDGIAGAAAQRVVELDDTPEWGAALKALIAACRDGQAGAAMTATVRELVSAVSAEVANATAERDLPARQRLLSLCNELAVLPMPNRRLLEGLFAQLSSLCKGEPSLWPEAARLELLRLDWRDVEASRLSLLELALEAEGNSVFTINLQALVGEALARSDLMLERDACERLFDSLAESEGVAPMLVALAILGQVGARLRWPEPLAARLRQARQHADPGVRASACKQWTASE